MRPLTPGFEQPLPQAVVPGSEALQDRRDATTIERRSESPLDLQELESGENGGSTEFRGPLLSLQPATISQVRDPDIAVSLESEASPETSPDQLPEGMTLFHEDSDFGERIYRRLKEGGYLTRPEPRSENLFVRSMDAVFRPEVVRVGGFSVSCSVITAIKRKNPLCLINPLVVHVSW
jgi:hypothetical protein